jgi:hypothetical protein
MTTDEMVAWIRRFTRELSGKSPDEQAAILELMCEQLDRERANRSKDQCSPSS